MRDQSNNFKRIVQPLILASLILLPMAVLLPINASAVKRSSCAVLDVDSNFTRTDNSTIFNLEQSNKMIDSLATVHVTDSSDPVDNPNADETDYSSSSYLLMLLGIVAAFLIAYVVLRVAGRKK